MVVVRLDSILQPLKDFFSKRDDVKLPILFGSIVRNGVSSYDFDIAIRFSSRETSFLDSGELTSCVASVLNLIIDVVNIVDLDRVNPLLIRRMLSNFIMIKRAEEDILELKVTQT